MTYQASNFNILMQNYAQTVTLADKAMSAAGTTQQKYDIYMQGTEAHVGKLTATLQGLWSNAFNSKGIQVVVDSLTGLVSGIDKVSSTFGLLPTVLGIATTALLLFNKSAMSFATGIIPSILSGGDKLRQFFVALTAEYEAMGMSAVTSGVALKGLRVALSELLISTGVGVAIAGVTWAISTLVTNHQKLVEQQTALKAQQEVISTNWTNQKDTIISLVAEYSTLREGDQRYLEVTNELAKLMPNLVESINAKGQAHLKSADAIKQELGYAQQLSTLENAKKLTGAQKSFDDIQSNKSGLQDRLDLLNNQMDLGSKGQTLIKYSADDIASMKIEAFGLQQQIFALTESAKQNIASLIASMAQASGIKFGDDVTTELTKIISKLDTSKMSAEQYNSKMAEISKTLINIQSIQSGKNGSSPSAFAAYSGELTKLQQELNLSDEQLKSFINIMNGVKPSSDSAKTSTVDYAESLKQLDTHIADTGKSIASLATDYQKLQAGEQLSVDETLKLVEQYPQLATYLVQHNGLIQDKGAILQQVAEIERKTRLDEAQHSLDSVTDTFNELESKRKMYADFYGKLSNIINPISASETLLGKYGGVPNANSGLSDAEQQQLTDAKKQQDQFKVRVALLSQPIDLATYGKAPKKTSDASALANEAKAEALQRENLTQMQIKSINEQSLETKELSKELEKKAQTAEKEKLYQQALEYTNSLITNQKKLVGELGDANDKIHSKADNDRNKLSSDPRNKYGITSDNVNSWFDANNQESSAYTQFKDDIAKRSENIVNSSESEKAKTAQLDKLKLEKQYAQDLFDSLLKLKDAYKANSDTIDTTNAAIEASQTKLIDNIVGNQTESIKTFETKIKALKTAMDSLKTDPAGKVADQNTIIDTYQQEQQQILSNIQALKDLSSTLIVNSDAWNKAQDEIKKYQDQSTQVESDTYAIKQKIATDTVDLMKKAYQAEKQAQIDALDAEKTAFDNATQAKISSIDQLRAAQNQDYTVSKDQEKAQLIQNQINALSPDTSNEAKSKVIDLKQQLADQQDKIDKEQQTYSDTLVKQDLQNKQTAYNQDIQNQKDSANSKYDAIINNDQLWTAKEADIINGHVQGIQTEMNGLIDSLSNYANNSMGQAKTNATQLLSLVSQVKSASTNLSGYSSTVNSPTAQSNSAISNGSTDDISWQDKLKRAATDDAYAMSEITRAKSVYSADMATGNTTGAQAANAYANQVRAKNTTVGSNPLYMSTGGYTGNGEGLAYLHSNELVLSKFDTSNILKVVDFTRDIMSKIKTPDFSNILPKITGAGGSNLTINLGGITVTGDQKGGQTVLDTIVNGARRYGININKT